jgi:hypothetical protein
VDDWDILWGHMKCRVAHPLRLIAFDVGDTPRHCIGGLKDDALLSGVGVVRCVNWLVVARWLEEQSRRVASKSISIICPQRKNNTILRGDMRYKYTK